MVSKAAAMDWLSGASLGLLVGLMVGLSVSPVAATVVGALSALIGGVFGLTEKLPAGLSSTGARRLTAFALATALALVIGILARTHQVLSPSTRQLRDRLSDIGISDPNEQRPMLIFLRFGLVPSGMQTIGKDGEISGRVIGGLHGFLYAENASFCTSLRTMIQNGSGHEDILSYLRSSEVKTTQNTAKAIAALPPPEQANALRAAPLYLCAV